MQLGSRERGIDADIAQVACVDGGGAGHSGDVRSRVEREPGPRANFAKTAFVVGYAPVSIALGAGWIFRRDAYRVSHSQRVRIHRAPDASRFAVRRRNGTYGDAQRRPEWEPWWAGVPCKRSAGSEDDGSDVHRRDAQPHGGRWHYPKIRSEESVLDATGAVSAKTIGEKHRYNRRPQEWRDHVGCDRSRCKARGGHGRRVHTGTRRTHGETEYIGRASRACIPGRAPGQD